MFEEELQVILNPGFSMQWPDPGSLSLKDTYDQLHLLHTLDDAIAHLETKKYDTPSVDNSKDCDQLETIKGEIVKNSVSNEMDSILLARAKTSATQQIEMNREALRTHAMALSRPSIRPLHILKLPEDVLQEIFAYLQDFSTASLHDLNPKYVVISANAKERIKNVQNTRLVCHLFNRLASPYLFPCLQVELRIESLIRIEKISKIPHLAKGVRGIWVGLQYRPRELAMNLEYYKIRKEQDLDEWYSICDYETEFERYGEGETVPEDYKAKRLAMYNRRVIDDAWNRYLDPESLHKPTEEELVYQQILIKGHEEFRRLHEEQFVLITDGTFVRTLSACMARMPSSGNIYLTDSMDDEEKYLDPYPDGTIVLNNKDKLADYMTYPCTWDMIENFSHPHTYELHKFELLPSRILSQLPIAIHQAGVNLRHINTACFPTTSNYLMICPGKESLDDPAWEDFREACQNLKTFSICNSSGSNLSSRTQFPLWELEEETADRLLKKWRFEKACVNKFLMASLSSRNLERVDISLQKFGKEDRQIGAYKYHHLGPVLANVNWPRIKEIGIREISLKGWEFENFSRGLGSTLGEIDMMHWQLKGGRWSEGLDIMRSKLLAGDTQRTPRVWLCDLQGAEIEETEVAQPSPSAIETLGSLSKPEDIRETLIQLLKQYMRGNINENPLTSL